MRKGTSAEGDRRRPAPKVGVAAVVVLVFAALLAVCAASGRIPGWLGVAYGLLSLTSFAAYGLDKSAARNNLRRTSEDALHLLDLLGGWPGGLLARHLFRHKTRKQPFRTVFWLTAAVNCGVLGWLLLATPLD